MINVTMEQIINFNNNNDFFANTNLPLKGAYKLNKLKQNVAKELEFYKEKFQKIVDTYAQKDDDGNLVYDENQTQIMIQEDKLNECNQALFELQNLEIEIENYNLSIDDLGEDLECTPDELSALMPFMD